jgi:hypothetical protein
VLTPHLIDLGLLGDSLTLCGSILLAWDALERVRNSEDNVKAAVKRLKGLRIEIDNGLVQNSEDVARVFIERAKNRAIWGCGFLAAGFLCLAIHRIIELNPSSN